MRVVILLTAILMTSGSAMAGAISITSPNHPQTFAYGEMIWHQLYLERKGGELAARITFSNLPYAGDDDPAFGWVDLAPGAKIYLLKESGRVTANLTATDYPRVGMRWIQMDNNFSLQNLLIALFRERRVQPGN